MKKKRKEKQLPTEYTIFSFFSIYDFPTQTHTHTLYTDSSRVSWIMEKKRKNRFYAHELGRCMLYDVVVIVVITTATPVLLLGYYVYIHLAHSDSKKERKKKGKFNWKTTFYSVQ